MSRPVEHHPEHQRFQIIENGILCVLDYELNGNTMLIIHTGVPQAVGGRGIAADLTMHALDTARENGWLVRPVCSYADAYIRRHKDDYADLLA